ncbi:MAG TPA: hypothetical protein EYP69_03030 [Bacteroidales bacterium]|nr:hypothetical protein [Bacteroidales bacterium]
MKTAIKKTILIALFFFMVPFLFGQLTVPYSTNYKFRDGIYLDFSMFLSNHPLPKESLVDFKKDDIFFLRNSLKQDTLAFWGNNALLQKIPTKEVWGFSENNYCYIYYNSQFNRILTIGTIGFFVANITVTKTYFNNYPVTGYYDPFYYPIGDQTIQSKELRRYLIDFTTGQVFPFDYNYFEQLISIDKEIFIEFANLRKRKKRKLMFFYLRQFNEKHPLMLPGN